MTTQTQIEQDTQVPFPAREHKGHPNIENLKYSKFSHYDQDSQAGLKTDKVLRNSDISRKNLTPEKLVEHLNAGYVAILRPAWRNDLPLMLLLGLSVVFAIYFAVVDPVEFSIFIPFLLPLTVLAAILHRHFNRRYVLTAGSVSVTTGIISFRMSELRSEYEKVKSVEVRKDLLQRILNVGDVAISTALIDQPELELVGLPNPTFYTSVLRLQAEHLFALLQAHQLK